MSARKPWGFNFPILSSMGGRGCLWVQLPPQPVLDGTGVGADCVPAVCVGTQTQVPEKSSMCLHHWVISPAQVFCFLKVLLISCSKPALAVTQNQQETQPALGDCPFRTWNCKGQPWGKVRNRWANLSGSILAEAPGAGSFKTERIIYPLQHSALFVGRLFRQRIQLPRNSMCPKN